MDGVPSRKDECSSSVRVAASRGRRPRHDDEGRRGPAPSRLGVEWWNAMSGQAIVGDRSRVWRPDGSRRMRVCVRDARLFETREPAARVGNARRLGIQKCDDTTGDSQILVSCETLRVFTYALAVI